MAILLSGPAFAGGVAPSSPPPVRPTVQPDWTEFYGGIQVETMDGQTAGTDFDGTLSGVFAGYRYDLGNVTIGAEIDFVRGNFDFGEVTLGATTLNLDYDAQLLRVGGEVGYDLGNALPYATAGYVEADLEFQTLSSTDSGFFYGVGLDFRASDRILIGAEALQHEFSGIAGGSADGSFTTFGLNVAFAF
ncbi:outer membrane protein [Gymnodinialimonas ulvae]|uniref:outer membrane protein n=1 Tax=Gymnodinialimonas ulvae TaxID=3126504 RepID=UPI0030EF1DF2